MKPPTFMRSARRLAGFTLIELLVTLALVAILGAVAVPGFKAISANQALSNTASELLSATMQARSAAMKTNQRVLVQPNTGTDWTSGWKVYIDADRNASYDSGTDTLIASKDALPPDLATPSWTGGSGDNTPITLFAFNGDGFAASVSGSFNGSILLQSSYTQNKRCLTMSRVGRTRSYTPTSSTGCG